jgi:hypothetical protein
MRFGVCWTTARDAETVTVALPIPAETAVRDVSASRVIVTVVVLVPSALVAMR